MHFIGKVGNKVVSYSYSPTGFLGIVVSMLPLTLIMIVPGCVALTLAHRKGYRGARYFCMGFFLSIFGLLFVGFMPEEENQYIGKLRRAIREEKEIADKTNP